MALSAKTNLLTGAAATGNQATTDPGFQPKGLLIFNGLQTAVGAIADAQFNLGFASSTTTEKSVSYNSDDNVATSDAVRVLNTARLIDIKTAGTTTNNIVADLTSFDATGFTLNWSTLTTTSPLFEYLALGGADITNVLSGNFTADSTNASQSVTGIGFQPDVIILTATLQNTSGASNNNNQFSLGVATANGDQWATSIRTRNAQATMNTTRAFHNTRCLVLQSSTTNAVFHEMTLASMDADGFTFTINTQGGLAFQIAYIAIKGGQWKVGTTTAKTSTEAATDGHIRKSVTGMAFQPKGIIFAGACDTQTAGTADHGRLHFGVTTGSTQNVGIWTGDRDDVPDAIANTIMSSSKCITMATEATSASPTTNADAALNSFDSGGFTLDWFTTDATARVFGYLAFGDNASGGSTQTLTGTGFANTNSFGGGTVTKTISLAGTGFANTNAFGAGSIGATIALTGTGYANTNDFGAGALAAVIALVGTGLASTNAFGTGALSLGGTTITGTGYENAQAFGAGAVAATVTLQGTGFANTNAFGSGTVAFLTTLTGTGFANTNSFGGGTLARTITLAGTGYENTQAFGLGAIAVGAVTVTGTGFANTAAFGAGSVQASITLAPLSLENMNHFGSGVVGQAIVTITGTGYQNIQQFGGGYLVSTIVPSSSITIVSVEDNIVIIQSPEDVLPSLSVEDTLVITAVEDNITVVE